jgi:dienelactone hydrolase
MVSTVASMTEMILFHHIQGLTPGVVGFADELRAAGHTVHTPDLFEGRTFESIEAGQKYLEGVGFQTVRDRGAAAADGLPEALVYGGFSLGGMPAQMLLQTRPGALGGLFYHSFADPSWFGDWPDGVPVQIHSMDADPFFVDEGDIDAARELVATAGAELFLYPGEQHLFADSSTEDYDADAAELVTERVLAFLTAIG